MEDFELTNNAKEQFKFFLNEDIEPCLNIRHGKELLAGFILDEEELSELIDYLLNMKEFINEHNI